MFARKGVGPQLEPPRRPKGLTRSCWPTRSVEASVLRYIGTVRRDKVPFQLFVAPTRFPLTVTSATLDVGCLPKRVDTVANAIVPRGVFGTAVSFKSELCAARRQLHT